MSQSKPDSGLRLSHFAGNPLKLFPSRSVWFGPGVLPHEEGDMHDRPKVLPQRRETLRLLLLACGLGEKERYEFRVKKRDMSLG